jgi:hypothetical protein
MATFGTDLPLTSDLAICANRETPQSRSQVDREFSETYLLTKSHPMPNECDGLLAMAVSVGSSPTSCPTSLLCLDEKAESA